MNSMSETDSWVICPVCWQPNPAGTRFCEHCWGAIIHLDSPVLSSQEAKEAVSRGLARLKRKKVINAITTSLVALVILASVLYPTLYYSTDIFFKSPQDLNSNSLPGEWAMFRHDLSHSGSASPSGIVPQGTLKWVFSTGGPIHSSPAVAYGTVYFGSGDYKLYAVDAATGLKRWEYETGSRVDSSPAIVNGVVYFGSLDGGLYALDAHSGEKLWDFQTKYPITSSPAVANGIVYFGGEDYYVYALDAVEGTKLWDFNTHSYVSSSPTVANGIVYVGTGGIFFYSLHALDGRLGLKFQTAYPGSSSPVVSDETLYFSLADGKLYAVDGNARTWLREYEITPYWLQLWAFGIPGIPLPPPPSGLLGVLRVGRGATSSPTVAGDTLYIGSDRNLVAVALQSFQELWKFETEGIIRSTPALADGTVYTGSQDGHLYAVDAATGKKLWDFLTGDKITSSPTIVDGTVYIGSHDGNLYAIK